MKKHSPVFERMYFQDIAGEVIQKKAGFYWVRFPISWMCCALLYLIWCMFHNVTVLI